MLAALFSGRHALHQDQDDGTVFIDRDSTHFRYVLNYLRDGGFRPGTLPADRCFLSELCTEADYYQLTGLQRLVTDHIAALDQRGDDERQAGGSLTATPPRPPATGATPHGRRLQRKVSAQQTNK